MASGSWILRRSTDVVARKVDEESIIVPIRQSATDLQCIYTLEGVGSRIWELADGQRTLDEIADAVTSEYDVPLEQARADVEEFADSLVDSGCAAWSSPSAGA